MASSSPQPFQRLVVKRPANIRKRKSETTAPQADQQLAHSLIDSTRERQRQRARSKGLALTDPISKKVEQDQPTEAEPVGLRLDSMFTNQKEIFSAEPNAPQQKEPKVCEETVTQEFFAASASYDEHLFRVPAHLVERVNAVKRHDGLDDATRWLAGMAEVDLGVEERMAAIEQKERAISQRSGDGYTNVGTSIPNNLSANFHNRSRAGSLEKEQE